MTRATQNILFLGRGNSARSILAEAIFNARSAGMFTAHSAGYAPKSAPHSLAIAHLEYMGHDTSFARSKSWDEFLGHGAPVMDFVFPVCASADGARCPNWPGRPMTARWGIPDPIVTGSGPVAERAAFSATYAQLYDRITLFLGTPFDDVSGMALQARLDAIGRIDEDARVARAETQL